MSRVPHILTDQRGAALIAVLLVTVIFVALVTVLLFQGTTERVVVVNETDHLKALGFAEAGLEWATRRAKDGSNYTALLLGPDTGASADDNLLGLRAFLSSGSLTAANETTKSRIVTKDFGDGSKSYEMFRMADDTYTRGLVYVRVDDNYDDDAADPTNNDHVADADNLIVATAVAEYPTTVDGQGECCA